MDLSKKKRKDAHFFLMNAIQSIILRILVTGRKSKQEILERQWTSIVFHDLKTSFSLLQKPEIVWPTLKQAISHRPFHRMKGHSEGPEMNLKNAHPYFTHTSPLAFVHLMQLAEAVFLEYSFSLPQWRILGNHNNQKPWENISIGYVFFSSLLSETSN